MQNIVSFIGLFDKREIWFKELTNRSHPIVSQKPSIFATQPIADMVGKYLEIISENYQFSTRWTGIL